MMTQMLDLAPIRRQAASVKEVYAEFNEGGSVGGFTQRRSDD
jgi:hypothetical protein